MKYCYQCPYYGEWTGTNMGFCSKLVTAVYGEQAVVERPCYNDEL